MLAEKHNVPLVKVAGIMSVLSPQVTFVQNVKSLEAFLETGGNCTVSTFSKQKVKADRIYALDNPTEDDVKLVIGKGLKTLSFFENIFRPESSLAVTIDLWQVRWAKSKRLMRQNDTLTDKRYRVIAESIARRAKKQGMMPHEYQALTWVEIRGKAF
jgi:hypothetical protein